MAHALQVRRFGGPDSLKLIETKLPSPAAGEVKVRVTASGINFADIMIRMGLYPEAGKPPIIPGYEIAGIVSEVGAGVTGFKAGDRVIGGTKFGGYVDEIVLPAYQLRRTPAKLSDPEAAAIPVNFMTAWIALEEMGRVRKGDRVLVQSAAGGVGVAATQIAARAGAEVVGLVGSPGKKDVVKSLGAHDVWLNDEWEQSGEDDPKYQGFDIVLDATGGKALKRSYRRLARGGRVVNFGVSSMVGQKRSIAKMIGMIANMPLYTPLGLMMATKGVFGLNMLQLYETPVPGKRLPLMYRALDQVLEGFEKDDFRAIVGKTFPLAEGGAAQDYLQSRGNVGKVVLTS